MTPYRRLRRRDPDYRDKPWAFGTGVRASPRTSFASTIGFVCRKRPRSTRSRTLAVGARQEASAGVRVSFAGRSGVLRRGRCGPACCVQALRCSCRAVACGDRGASFPTVAAGLLFGVDGVAGAVSQAARPGCLPSRRNRLGRHDSPGVDQGLCLSRRAPRCSRRSREAAVLPCADVLSSRMEMKRHRRIRSIRPRRPRITAT